MGLATNRLGRGRARVLGVVVLILLSSGSGLRDERALAVPSE